MHQFVSANESDVGLDRSTINARGQIQLLQQHVQSDTTTRSDRSAEEKRGELGATNTNTGSRHRTLDSINEKRHDAASKLRRKLHLSSKSDLPEPIVLASTGPDNSDSRLTSGPPESEKLNVKDLLHSPVETIKSKVCDRWNQQVAANVAAKEIAHGNEVDLVKAHLAVKNAGTMRDKIKAMEDRGELMRERQNMFVRWTLDRHVSKVRVNPRITFVKKSRSDFITTNLEGAQASDWDAYSHYLLQYFAHTYGGQYIGYGSEPPTPSKESIMPNIERSIVASAPLQKITMAARRIYRWESRTETFKYLFAYMVLWAFDLLLPGLLSALVYFVVMRRMHGPTLEDLKDDITRAEDQFQMSTDLSELIIKEGNENWSDSILEKVGPWFMVQLCDVANGLETMRNFYEWRVPSRTILTLALICGIILATVLVPAWLWIKSITLSVGIFFFGLFPIATNFPKYRLLASPTKRLFWNIPTHAEWSIKLIQAEGSRYQEEHTKLSADPKFETSFEYSYYTCSHNGNRGRVAVSRTTIRFVSNIGHDVHWTISYDQISRIEKITRLVGQRMPDQISKNSEEDLKIILKGKEESEGIHLLASVKGRNELFSQILGFSNTEWQVVW
ncbi:hypothetical protein P154DRAFT_255636 [Amniculicola lignicola CBS 123094]|uniref:GRAM domain-containing protein n=1 Tax=Amniculicola lignicola CBS 123094 TaxID=1392246 RepID=A0A6A5WWV9_9PLEO|nr:hypothetical protein P154DRAFT_255636 [Amniculicola lignicola CBS 123094]